MPLPTREAVIDSIRDTIAFLNRRSGRNVLQVATVTEERRLMQDLKLGELQKKILLMVLSSEFLDTDRQLDLMPSLMGMALCSSPDPTVIQYADAFFENARALG